MDSAEKGKEIFNNFERIIIKYFFSSLSLSLSPTILFECWFQICTWNELRALNTPTHSDIQQCGLCKKVFWFQVMIADCRLPPSFVHSHKYYCRCDIDMWVLWIRHRNAVGSIHQNKATTIELNSVYFIIFFLWKIWFIEYLKRHFFLVGHFRNNILKMMCIDKEPT